MPVTKDRPGDSLGIADLPGEDLARITSEAAGQQIEITEVRSHEFDYSFGSPATAGIWRVDVDYLPVTNPSRPATYSYFVKLLRHPRLWPGLAFIPEGHFRDEFIHTFPWRTELDMNRSGVIEILPEGMWAPTLHHVSYVDDDHLVLWWQYVEIRSSPWSLTDFARAARLLGQLAARRREGMSINATMPTFLGESGRGVALRYYTRGRVFTFDVPAVQNDQLWRHSALAEAVEQVGDNHLRADLLALAERVPGILDRLDQLPQTYAHGDASPQNLLTPADRPDTVLVIDWGFSTPQAVGFDLGQLLVGLAHAGQIQSVDLAVIHEAILPAYVEGLQAEGFDVDPAAVKYGYLGSLACRSALSSIPYDSIDESTDGSTLRLLTQRLELTRVLLDLTSDV